MPCGERELKSLEGADVIHPAPGSEGRPSFTAVVGNVDSHTAKYIARTCVQTSRQEMIDDLKPMCTVRDVPFCIAPVQRLMYGLMQDILKNYIGYRSSQEKQANPNPKRLIFFRGMTLFCPILGSWRFTCYLDGVSEGQFQQVLDNGVLRYF